MSRLFSLCGALLAASLANPASAADWIWESGSIEDKAGAVVRFQTRLDLWVAEFDRPDRACEAVFGAPPTRLFSLRSAQIFPPGAGGCGASDSDEIAMGLGAEVSFRVTGPLHVTAGVNFLYTAPDSSLIENQLIIAIPFGVLFTVQEWEMRPIVQPTITPLLYITDDSRDYSLGIDFGGAWRMLEWGDLSLTIGYESADTMSSWQIQIAVHPL